MATRAANKRLTREYATIQANPPPYIVAHPSENNILEWHYILTGPPNTPYVNGQYWGTLLFPPTYPFAPPSIRMHTPSGRFQPSTRLCLSISDFHPKAFNPAWEVSTILIGLMSFMTSDEMTTGSLGASDAERKWLAARSRWWNSTGGGSVKTPVKGNIATVKGVGAVKAGDGGVKFRAEWPELDEENWKWMREHRIDAGTGKILPNPGDENSNTSAACSPEVAALKRGPGGTTGLGDAGRAAREAGQGWVRRNKLLVVGMVVIGYVLMARLVGEGGSQSAHFIPWSSPICDADVTPGKPDAGTSGMAASVSLARVIFLNSIVEQVEDYKRALRDFAADAMIVDMFGFGPMMFGEMRGLRYVTMSLQPRINFDHPDLPAGQEQGDYWGSPAFMGDFRPLVNAARARLGLSPLLGTFRFLDAMISPYLHLMQTTTAFEPADRIHMPQVRSVGPMQPMPAIDFTPPKWWAELVSRNYFVVHVTQGTYSANSTDSESLIHPTICALEHEDCLVVVTVPTNDTETFFATTLPANVHVEPFIPHTELLPFVDIMITNVGYNGALAALSHCLPLVCAGISEDKADMSTLTAQSGAGINLKTDRPTEAQIRDAVKTVRQDPKYAREAKRIQDDFAGHDSAVESCDLIENLVKCHRPHSTP